MNLIGVLIGGISLVVTIVLFFYQRSIKRLSYEVLTSTRVLSADAKGTFTINYNGVSYEDVRILELKIWNSGNVAITSADFETDISIILPDGAQLINFEEIDKNPKSLKVSLKRGNERTILVHPLLLNKKDSFFIKVIFSLQSEGPLSVSGRIKDIPMIVLETQSKENVVWNNLVNSFIVFFLVLGLKVMKNPVAYLSIKEPDTILVELVFLLFLSLALISILQSKALKNLFKKQNNEHMIIK